MSKKFIHCALTALISLFAINTAAHSQTPPPQPAANNSPKLRALTIGYENELKDLEMLDADLQSVGKLSLRQFTFSKGFTCPIVEGTLNFGIPNGTNEEGIPIFKQVASVKWQSSYKQVCLIFIPKSLAGKSNGTQEYIVQVLDMSTGQFKLGHTKVMNFTPFETMVRIGEQQTSLKPWTKSEVKKVNELTGVKMAQVSVFYNYNNAIHNAQQTRFRYLEDTRYITLIYPDLVNKRVGVKIVKDFGNLY